MKTITQLDQIENKLSTGHLFIALLKAVVTDDGTVISATPHRIGLHPEHLDTELVPQEDGTVESRTVIVPASDLAATLVAVNADLVRMGFPPISDADKAVIAAYDVQRLAIKVELPPQPEPAPAA